ncbi:acyl-CoA dehydrogenase [Aeromicrobium sp. 636]|uniref:Acyl-CoA dehydrogenase family protein n=1 Tax=Aeromicrobium senzhongii TaxID=2663859 RepID=A0A8I0EXG3_9ACTN|nr:MULTISPECIES: acyl-CoA dehydrogenase family protein [Aeromicrobium]MBC9227493.1 acyl-CoA dehydrogenase family protein [Aeromicrobium senzhongii]MCQ3999590.1 acyl-CoA dehydrogenase [Aeromicrobium sp. 636]
MRLTLSPELDAFRHEMREFFTTQVPWSLREPVIEAAPLDRDVIVDTHRILHAAGLAVPGWPVRWGGRDWSTLQRHLWSEEMHLAGVFPPLSPNVGLVGPVIAAFGSPEMQLRFLPATAALDIFWCQGFSEPEAGSDLASVRTTAVRDGDSWVVNGQKTWTSLAHWADWMFCLVRTDPDAPKRQGGISMLLIDLASPGITIRPIEMIDGEAEVNEVFLEDVRVPADQLVGEVNRGWEYAKFLLGNERVGVAQVGNTKMRLGQAKQYAHSAGPDGRSAWDDPRVRARFADLENALVAVELTALRVAAESADGRPDPASSVLKLRGTQLQQQVAELVCDLAGPAAVLAGGDDPAVARWARRALAAHLNARKVSIYGGSNEIQRGIIASGVLGL